MRTLMTCLLAGSAVVASAASPAAAQDDLSFAYIDSQRIMDEAPGAQEARAELERQIEEFQAELQELEQEIQQRIEEYDQRQVMMSPEARRSEQEEILELQNEFDQRRTELQQAASQRQSDLLEPIMQRINEVITALREERGYTMIFDSAAGALIAADPSLDLTGEVLERLRAEAEATASNGG
ncbi:MAG: OmpH family outer membrane protein [Gemmatimonadota bacterium]